MNRNVGRFLRAVALALTAFVIASCGMRQQSGDWESISGRFAAETKDYAPVVMVQLPNGSGVCSGTFVSDRAVLTAAHCVLSSGAYTVKTDFGDFITYQRVYTGEGDVNSSDDIGLLIFDKDVAGGHVYPLGDSLSYGETLRLVGFGCNDLTTRLGAGTKRTGTNTVAEISEFIEFRTPVSMTSEASNQARGILGPENRAASCFGDSGGPALQLVNGEIKVVGVTHAGGQSASMIYSEYVNVASHASNRSWLRAVNNAYYLGMEGL